MYSRPAAARASAISSSREVPSGSARSILKLPDTSSSALRGRLLMTATMPSMVEVMSGAIYIIAVLRLLVKNS